MSSRCAGGVEQTAEVIMAVCVRRAGGRCQRVRRTASSASPFVCVGVRTFSIDSISQSVFRRYDSLLSSQRMSEETRKTKREESHTNLNLIIAVEQIHMSRKGKRRENRNVKAENIRGCGASECES